MSRFFAAASWVMTYESAREIAPKEMEQFEEAVEEYNEVFDGDGNALFDLEYDMTWQGDGEAVVALLESYRAVREAILEKTGLIISAAHQDLDAQYDDEGLWPCFWCENVEEYTAPGRKAVSSNIVSAISWAGYA